jgi:hypothetical protein
MSWQRDLNPRPADYKCYWKSSTPLNITVFALFNLPKGLKIGTSQEEVLPKVLPAQAVSTSTGYSQHCVKTSSSSINSCCG